MALGCTTELGDVIIDLNEGIEGLDSGGVLEADSVTIQSTGRVVTDGEPPARMCDDDEEWPPVSTARHLVSSCLRWRHEAAGHHFGVMRWGESVMVCAFCTPPWHVDQSRRPRQRVLDHVRYHNIVNANPHRWHIDADGLLAKSGIVAGDQKN